MCMFCWSFYLSLSVILSIYLPVSLSRSCLSFYLSTCPSVHLPIYLSDCLFSYPTMSWYLFICVFFLSLFFCLSVCLSLYIYISVCVCFIYLLQDYCLFPFLRWVLLVVGLLVVQSLNYRIPFFYTFAEWIQFPTLKLRSYSKLYV